MTAEERAPAAGFDLKLGPLHYRFIPGDDWGGEQVRALAGNLAGALPPTAPDRIVQIARTEPAPGESAWQRHDSPLGTIAYHTGSPAAAWTATASPELPAFRYQLPWALLIADCARRSGAVVHAGFAARNGRGLLFLAPPGGGKSTTLASVPAGWAVLSDDAALVWPEQGVWQASPLPSWTTMTAAAAPESGQRFDPGRQCGISGLLVLAKEPAVSIDPLTPLAAAPHLYRALNEYPATVLTDLPLQEHFFRTACAMARALPCWRLGLPRGADCWPRLEALIGAPP